MKNTCKSVRVLVAALITFGSLSVQSHAAITISNFQISSSVVSFDVSGELSGPTPADDLAAIFFVNSNATLDPGFVVPSGFTAPLIHTWTGSQAVKLLLTRTILDYSSRVISLRGRPFQDP
jgi:hypothetical protein